MTEKSPRIWLSDIRYEISEIMTHASGVSEAGFSGSWVSVRAVEHGLLIIAEACKHLPADLKSQHPEVPWQRIHGLGNLLRHEYRRIEPAILWSIVTEHLDALSAAVDKMLTAPDGR